MEKLQLTPSFQLSYEWSADRESLKATRLYKTLDSGVKSSFLLSPQFFALVTEMVNLSKSIEQLCTSRDFSVALGKGEATEMQTAIQNLMDFHPIFSRARKEVKTQYATLTFEYVKLQRESTIAFSKRRSFRRETGRACRQCKRNVLQASERLRRLDTRLSKLVPSLGSVISSIELFECDCGNFQLGRRSICGFCGKTPKGNPLSATKCDPTLVAIVSQWVWFELAVSNLFKENGFKTIVGSRVHGPSGASHEMDVIAYDEVNHVNASAEVTAGNGSLSQLSEVMLRKGEFPFQNYLLITLGPSDHSAVNYGQTHGVWVFGDLRKSRRQLIRWIKEYRRHTTRLSQRSLNS